MPLTDLQIKNLKTGDRVRKVSDGGGLYVHVTPQGSKLFRMAYRFAGRQKTLSFGRYPATTLAEARAKRDNAKATLAAGTDPGFVAKLEKQAAREASANTFRTVAEQFLTKRVAEGASDVTISKKRWLLSLAVPDIGHRPVAEITAVELLIPLKRVEADGKYETARRLRGAMSEVFRYAIATARTKSDPTYGLRGALITPKATHRAALVDRASFARLVTAIWRYDGSPGTRYALRLMALLYPRPGELRFARWDEFDEERALWIIPVARTKMRREHRKPLPALAIKTLRELDGLGRRGEFVLPASTTYRRPMSENTMNTALRRMGFAKDEATAHGFRSSASSLLNESGMWSPDAIEAELGHADRDEVRGAYHRATYWDERERMCEWWAEQLLGMLPTSGEATRS